MQRDGIIIDGPVSMSESEESRVLRDSEARQLFKSSQNTLFQEERIEVLLIYMSIIALYEARCA